MTATKITDTKTAALAALYAALAAKRQPTVREKSPEDRAAYMREAKRRQRERQREAASSGNPEDTDEAIRTALANAALTILAVDGPGADAITAALRKTFPGRGGVASTVRSRAKAGTLKPLGITRARG